MNLVDRGSGPPLVLVPGIQGRWEWMDPAVEALSRRCRVLSFSLADEPSAAAPFDARRGFDEYVRQVGDAMDQAGLSQAAVCGVSYGGLIAAAFAARHPSRVAALVLVSALPPSWKPDRRVRFFLTAPRLLSPLFYLMSLRIYREIAAAHDSLADALRAARRHGWNVLTHRLSPARMAQRVQLLAARDLPSEIRRLTVRTLVITGQDPLDLVVPPRRTREYLSLCDDVRTVTLARTGHIGLITRPEEFARVVCDFVREDTSASESRRHIG